MKKLLSILLALSLVYGLCGCANNEAASQTEPIESTVLSGETVSDTVDTAEVENKEISYDFTVSVTIPAAFMVYLDDTMNIVSVEPGDADAEAIVSQLDVSGMPYDDGFGLVLNAAYEQGILADQGKVHFALTCDDFSTELMQTLFTSVMQFEKDNGIFVFIDWDLSPVEEPDFEANYLYNLQKIEEGDQTIYLDKAPNAHPYHGQQTVYTYYSEFPVFIDSNLVRTKMLCFNENGTWIVEYFKDGRTTKVIEPFDGFLQISEHKNGMLAFQSRKYEDGSYSFEEVVGASETGPFNPVKSVGCGWDGTQYASTYHSNGNIATDETIGSDGSFCQRTYDESGNEIHTYLTFKSADGIYTETEFENNQPVYEKTVFPDGTYQEGHCENGNWTWTEGVIEPTDPES